MSVRDIRGEIMQAAAVANEAMGGVQQALERLDVAVSMIRSAGAGSSDADWTNAAGMWMRAEDDLNQNVQPAILAGVQAAESVAARL